MTGPRTCNTPIKYRYWKSCSGFRETCSLKRSFLKVFKKILKLSTWHSMFPQIVWSRQDHFGHFERVPLSFLHDILCLFCQPRTRSSTQSTVRSSTSTFENYFCRIIREFSRAFIEFTWECFSVRKIKLVLSSNFFPTHLASYPYWLDSLHNQRGRLPRSPFSIRVSNREACLYTDELIIYEAIQQNCVLLMYIYTCISRGSAMQQRIWALVKERQKRSLKALAHQL